MIPKKDKIITKKQLKEINFYETLGVSKGVSTSSDFYRFKRVRQHIYGNSVLDVGCGRADFLKLIKPNYKIAGIEINRKRVEYCNKILGKNVVIIGNLEEKINLEDSSYDTIICMEVLEHLVNPKEALKELTRISRKRIIITVPFNEKIRWVLCAHCGRYTPMYGHLHSFNKENIKNIIPDNARLIKIELIGNRLLDFLSG